MPEQLTPQQMLAIQNRGGKLLVSAAAGSGKTKVLVDRLMSYLTDPIDPANIDDFLIITYTRAAAAELRGKIAEKLTERIALDPENRHLQRQTQRLYLSKISTVHSFCGDILREYAYRLDIPADFRNAEDNDCTQLQEMAMSRLLDEAYETIGDDADFRAFVDTQGLGRNDSLVPEIILKVYNSARCHLDPDKWLLSSVEETLPEGITDAAKTLWGKYLVKDLFDCLDRQIPAMSACAQMAENVSGWEKAAAVLWENVQSLTCLRESSTWDQIMQHRNLDFGTLRFDKKYGDPELAERIKAVRNNCKDDVGERLSNFANTSTQVLEDLARSADAARGMISLVHRFGKYYDSLKRSRRLLDFGDLEHITLELLLGKSRSTPTAAAAEIGERFREIMVDEYQDSNEVQDAIFTALTSIRYNLFMVGDVKQSIYQFRLAEPRIFLDKYASFVPAETAAAQQGRKVMLSSNFRSGGGVIDAVNAVFRTCMSPNVGGLFYGDVEALREGIPHIPLGEPEVELHTIEVQEETGPEEAAFVAKRISELLDGTHFVRQGEELRPIIPEDIVILLRSPSSSASYFSAALEQRGIRCVTGGNQNLLQTQEIGTLRSLLQVISNPRQDIPLLAALANPVFGFTADDLAAFRSKNRKMGMYDALCQDDSQKSNAFLQLLADLRREASVNSLPKLLELIFVRTRMDSIYAAMPDGAAKAANLQAFYQLTVDFEQSGRWALDQFLEYLDNLEAQGISVTREPSNAGAVRILSIHKSKGLEYPVVFLCGLGKQINRESVRSQVLCDKTLGLGLSCVDTDMRVRYPALSKQAIKKKILNDELSEEMRVLYVAMTRARDRLIMTYASRSLEADLTDIVLRLGVGDRELISGSVNRAGKWVLMTALGRTEAGELFQLAGRPGETHSDGTPWMIKLTKAPEVAPMAQKTSVESRNLPQGVFERLKDGLAFRYGYLPATTAPSKQTATQRKGRFKDQEAAEDTVERDPFPKAWRKPGFLAAEKQGKTRGSAVHAALQYIRYESCADEASVKEEIKRLVAERYITQDQGDLISAKKLAAFFATDLGKKLRTSADVLREFKFSILDDGAAYGPELEGEKVLLQGVVDCALLEEDGITIIDFKTDYVTEEILPAVLQRYRPQVETYADALNRIYEKPIKSVFLYFFHLDRFVAVK